MEFRETKVATLLDSSFYPQWITEEATNGLEQSFFKSPLFFGKNRDGILSSTVAVVLWMGNRSLIAEGTVRSMRSLGAKYAWGKAVSLYGDNNGQAWLVEAISSSYPQHRPHTNHQGVLPKSDAENWKKELHKSLEKAYTSALATPDNYLGWLGQLDEEYRVTLVGNNKNPDDQLKLLLEEKNPFELFYPHDLLQIMLKSLEKTEPNAFFYNTKVNGKDAQRAYFIRSLTCALLQDFEKPCRKLVTIITSTMFDDESITEQKVTQICRGLKPENYPKIVNPIGFNEILRKSDGDSLI